MRGPSSATRAHQQAPVAYLLFRVCAPRFFRFAELASDEYTGLPPSEVVLVDPGSRLGTKPERPKRGGSILGWPNVTTVSYRLGRNWNDRDSTLGFRLVRTLK